MDQDELIARLMASFLEELDEGLATLERNVLALERTGEPGPNRDARVEQLMRTAHSLKGAARAADVNDVEHSCHHLEGLLGSVRADQAMDAPLLSVLFSAVDGLKDASTRLHSHHAVHASPPDATPAGPAPSNRLHIQTTRVDRLLALSADLSAVRIRLDNRQEEMAGALEELRVVMAEWHTRSCLARTPHERPADSPPLERLLTIERALTRLSTGLETDRRMLRLCASPLGEEIRNLRMVPFSRACDGLQRTVRDLGQSTGKSVHLVLKGQEVELDGAVVDALKAPLLHLVRNAIDHGVELPHLRAAAHKPTEARLVVSALLTGNQVQVSVQDDGKGLDLVAIRQQAQDLGLRVPTADEDVARLVFRSGLSTASSATNISGRGVGLDVVVKQVESVQGSASVSFVPGGGTTFTLTVPLTLGMVRALMVRTGGQTLALAQNAVERVVRIDPRTVVDDGNHERVTVDGHAVTVAPLTRVLGINDAPSLAPDPGVPAVVLATGEHRVAVVVEAVLGEGEFLVKGLQPRIRRLRHVVGVTQLPDGNLVPVLNTRTLVDSVQHLPATSAPLHTRALPSGSTRKILLLVEDSPTTRQLLHTILQASGYQVLTATDGMEALDVLQHSKVHAIITDVQMPRMDGIELTRTLRSTPLHANLPVILVTGLSTPEDRLKGLEAGANAYLVKSTFDQQALLDTLTQLL